MGYFAGIKGSDEFESIIKQLRNSFPSIDVSKFDGLRDQSHITVAHLGKQRPDTERFQDVGGSSQPFEISIEGARIFRNQETTHLVLPVVQGAGELRLLNASLRTGGKIPDRNYTPHMTVISAPSDMRGESAAYKEMLAFRDKYNGQQWGRMVVASFHIFSSSGGVVKPVDQWRMTSFKEVM